MAYINIETKEYPLFEGDIRLAHPEIGEEFILPTEYAEVFQDPTPEHTDEEYIVPEPIKLVKGKWVQKFRIERLSDEEILKLRTYPLNPTKQYEWNEIDKVWVEIPPKVIGN